MYLGIDLGTTNSVAAIFDGRTLSVVSNSAGETSTPSVVRLDGRGGTLVGRRAQRFLESDPANTRAEFKRLMGTAERLPFELAGRALAPEELSAEVLKSLLADVRDRLGCTPRGAAISTPALFELPQNHATMRAGKLAGLEEVALIQEPIASAIAAGWKAETPGLWLVFDLGGGTLDVSLLETRDGWLRVVEHGGDNFLGGKDFDNVIVDWAAQRVRAEHGLEPFSSASASGRRTLAKLKAACEQARIELSRAERTAIVVPELCLDAHGANLDLDVDLTRAEAERLLAPLVERAVEVCRSVLAQAHSEADAVAHVVFVGGPTLTPLVRSRVGELFGGRVALGVDPMTVVASGAALFAATSGLEARPSVAVQSATALALRLEHPAVTADLEPFVVGRCPSLEQGPAPARVRVERLDGAFASPDTALSAEGAFVLQVRLEPHCQNRFRLTVLAEDGSELAAVPAEFAIVHGLSIADPPLSRSVGVALADDTMQVYFAKGIPLPARRTFVHLTTRAVAALSPDDALAIPVVQGEYHRAHRNRLIGTLRLAGVKASLPAASRVEVTLQLDRSGQLQASALVPALEQSFADVAHVLVPSASRETLEAEAAGLDARLADLRRRSFVAGEVRVLQGADKAARLAAEAHAQLQAAHGPEADASQRVLRLLLEAGAALDDAEEALEWPELLQEADETIEVQLGWVSQWGTPSEQGLFERALEACSKARAGGRAAELDRQLKVLRSLGLAAFHRDPHSPRYQLEWYEAHLSEATDLKRAHALVEQGRAALGREDQTTLKGINKSLDALFPGTARERTLSFGSGVK